MADDQKKPTTDDTEGHAFKTLDDQQEDTVDVSDTDLENIANGIMDNQDEPLDDDEITFSELGEEEDGDEEENNDVDNLRPGGIDEGTD